MSEKRITKGATLHITGEALVEALKLPKDAKIFKIIPTEYGAYSFVVLYFSEDGFELEEGSIFPWASVEKRRVVK